MLKTKRYIVRFQGLADSSTVAHFDKLKVTSSPPTAATNFAPAEAFDIRDFHSAVLKNGALPLTFLEEQIDDYIQATLVAAAQERRNS